MVIENMKRTHDKLAQPENVPFCMFLSMEELHLCIMNGGAKLSPDFSCS